MTELTRRGLAGALAAAGGAAACAQFPDREGGASVAGRRPFPYGFKWGCATAAYQIEGAVNEDGRGRSIWDDFVHTPGRIADGATADVACDSYHRYRDDTRLLKALGANIYRFSIAWPRIFPQGRGAANAKGVSHYDRVVDDLLAHGIEPHICLYHWDLPAALAGGWQSRDTAEAFAEYAGFMAEKLSDRVNHFMTLNEMASFVDIGYGGGGHAPGLKLPAAALNQVRHHALLAHGLGVQAIRARGRSGTRVGLAENPLITVPTIETPENVAAARLAMRDMNASYLTPVLEGRYTDAYQKRMGADAPAIRDGDMAVIGSKIDFVGLNIYTGIYVQAAAEEKGGYEYLSPPKSHPKMLVPWLRVLPDSLYWGPRLLSEVWNPQAIFISENGAPSDDVAVDGKVNDTDRLMYLQNYVGHLQRACAEGYPVSGYFLWTLLDNFEWAEGFTKRFGIHHTDFATQQRTPKLSALWYRELIQRNAMA
jgi:beta-glucosidase